MANMPSTPPQKVGSAAIRRMLTRFVLPAPLAFAYSRARFTEYGPSLPTTSHTAAQTMPTIIRVKNADFQPYAATTRVRAGR